MACSKKNIAVTKLQHEKELLMKAKKNFLSELNGLYTEQIAYIQFADDIDMEIQEKIDDYIKRYNYNLNKIATINDTLSILKEL